MRPTIHDIEAAKTERGGWTREQLAEWGVPWPPPSGWRKHLEEEDGPVLIGKAAVAACEIAGLAMQIAPKCESPIEVQLGAHLLRSLSPPFELRPQFKLGRFRFDFAIMVDEHAIMLIECDGKEFHSTPEQIENDQRKDKLAAAVGIKLLRFTGREIFHHPAQCAERVLRELAA